MACHVHQTCRVCYYHLKNVASIRSCLTEQSAIRLVQYYLMVSRLDYGNALLFGIPDVLIGKLYVMDRDGWSGMFHECSFNNK